MKHPEADLIGWKEFVLSHPHRWCWFCGRGTMDRPDDWAAPFLIERAHIVSSPRIEDRRVAVLLCSVCHAREHGQCPGAEHEIPTLAAKLWLKSRFDPRYYDREFLQRFHVRRLPRAQRNARMLRETIQRRPVARIICCGLKRGKK